MIIMVKIEHCQTIIESDKLKQLKLLVSAEINEANISTKEALYRAAEYYIEKHEKKAKK